MRLMLLANRPNMTIRLKKFQETLGELGYEVIVPHFDTMNWERVAREANAVIKKERPDVVQVFNVPDMIYRNIPKMKGSYFDKLIYDYRSPWGLSVQMSFGYPGRIFGEHFERKLAINADAITTVNTPLEEKLRSYDGAGKKEIYVIPNYPTKKFIQKGESEGLGDEAIIFVGRICRKEGIKNLLRVAKKVPDEEIWIVGGSPFAWWHLRKMPKNVKAFGWQPHEKIPSLVRRAKMCLVTINDTTMTPYLTDRSVLKVSEYLNLGKLVIASGITKEEDRKNLIVVKSSHLEDAVCEYLNQKPEPLRDEDYRLWEDNRETIREVYEGLL
ncbi:MAG: glycosyltransferase [Methanothrix sp.]